MTMWPEPEPIDVARTQIEGLEAEVAALRRQLEAVKGLLFVADMFEKCAEHQEQWSGPAQAVFTAVRKWRESKQPAIYEKLKKRVEDLEAGQRNDDRDYQRLTSALRRLLDERLLVCTSECVGGTHVDSCGIGITTRTLLPKEEG